jgi:hypothetical protein
MRSDRRKAGLQLLYAIPSVFLLGWIAMHAGIVGLGQWQGDEYDYAASLREQGLGFALHRVATHSPRPLSEFFICLYMEIVNSTGRPLIGPVLGLGWTIFLLGCNLPLIICYAGRLLPRLFVGLCLTTLFLIGHPAADLFYWPFAAIAYLPTVAALTVVTIQILDDRNQTSRGRLISMLSLLVAGASSEIGSMVVLAFVSSMLATATLRRGEKMGVAWLIPPLLLSVGVLSMTILHRGAEPPTILSLTSHNMINSIRSAFIQALRVILEVDPNDADWGQENSGYLAYGVPIKLVVFVGFVLSARRCFGRAPLIPTLALILSLFIGITGSTLSAYYQFGFLCCQRHETLRQCLIVLTILGVATMLGSRQRLIRVGAVSEVASVTCLTVAIMVMAVWRIPNLVYAYHHSAESDADLKRTWDSGFGSGSAIIMSEPDGPLVHSWSFPTGEHKASPTNSFDVGSIMRFFRKRDLLVLPSSQSP